MILIKITASQKPHNTTKGVVLVHEPNTVGKGAIFNIAYPTGNIIADTIFGTSSKANIKMPNNVTARKPLKAEVNNAVSGKKNIISGKTIQIAHFIRFLLLSSVKI